MEWKKNQLVTLEIEDMGNEGEGIGKLEGYPFFIKDAIIGDKVLARITRVKKNYSYGRLEKVLKPSPFRIEPPCPCHRQCGGCQIQAMSYEQQLVFKQSKIRNNLIRIGGFSSELADSVMEPMVGMERPFRYRNKAQYPIGTDKEGNPIAGFYAGRTHSIIANTDCYLGVEENREILEILLAHMKKHQISAYEETTGNGLVRHVLIRKGFTSKQLMVCLVLNYRKKKKERAAAGKEGAALEYIPHQQELIEALAQVHGMTGISVSIHTENTNVIMGKEVHTIWGSERITDTIHRRDAEHAFALTGEGLTFGISPLSFYQVNPVQTEKLYSLALQYAGLTGKETVWDLYCGIGTISLFLAAGAGKVYGVEAVPEAIWDARENARSNNISNAEFFVGKAEEVLPAKYVAEGIHADVIVVDPPRKGCDEACLQTMLKMQPERIVYVSCDSATMARDLKILGEGGYELKRVRGVDQFAMTVGIETVCLLSKRKPKPDSYVDLSINMEDYHRIKNEEK